MMCESCGENLATVHLTEIVQKVKKETHLCEECAKQKGVSYSAQFSVKDFLSGLAKSKPEPEPASEAEPEPEAAAVETLEDSFQPCPSCGITFAEFRENGRFGCYNDYDHFKDGLYQLLEKIHGHRQHTGRVPERIGERIKKQREIVEHTQMLRDAVDREDYESAAKLRDEIKALEAGERT